jgi:hypothetical protein
MLERWFFAHPRSVKESYLEHQGRALKFSLSLFAAAGACLVHALVPGLFERTGSRIIEQLHRDMVARRNSHDAASPARAPLSRSDA